MGWGWGGPCPPSPAETVPPLSCRAQSKRSVRGLTPTVDVGGSGLAGGGVYPGELPNAPRCFSARPCIVGEWSPWSGCADQCKPAARVRRRPVQQEPLNGGAPCPPLEERAGCLDYSTPQGQDCGHSFGTEGFTAAAFVVWFSISSNPLKGPVLSRESSVRAAGEWNGPVCPERTGSSGNA